MARLSSNSSLTALRHPAALPTETQDQSIKDIFKCGICSVKLIKESELASTAYQRFWVVFYVLNEQAPILELFKKEQPLQNFNNQDSVAKYSLKNCHYVSIPILNSANDKENSNEFVISLDTQLLQICVDSQESNDKELLHEWVNCLREKLASLNVFSSQDNPYSKEPVNVIKKMSSRPPMPLPAARPLPPIPRQAALQFPPQIPLPSIPSEGQQELVTVASSSSSSQSNGHVTRQTNGQSRQAQVSRTMERILDRLNGTRSSPTENSIHSLYSTPNPNFSKFVTSISVNYGLPGASSSENNYESLAAAASSQQDIPRPSSSNCPTGSNGQQVLSLRESQIVTLRKEINNPGGVRLKIRKVDCVDSLALVEWLGRIFIAGWKQKFYPQLHNTFHLGDEIVCVNGSVMNGLTPKDVITVIRHSDTAIVEFIIRRTPFAQIFLLKREFEFQDLGIVREGNTDEILFIEPNSLAHRQGIPNQTKPADPLRQTDVNWAITEINFRPCNLFFKGDEIKNRLNSVGLEVSLLLQPLDLVKNIKKQLKQIKNYKDYVVQ